MSDVKVERKESVSRQSAADWLELLAKAFAEGGHVELRFGPDVVSLHVPDRVRAEFEVEVERIAVAQVLGDRDRRHRLNLRRALAPGVRYRRRKPPPTSAASVRWCRSALCAPPVSGWPAELLGEGGGQCSPDLTPNRP